MPSDGTRLAATYVLPLRWTDDRELLELTSYLRWLAGQLEVIVVDGSPDELYAAHAALWNGSGVQVIKPTTPSEGNGKVAGVVTGVLAAGHEAVLIADDDVRWTRPEMQRALGLLARADLVRPQNVFVPMPWHARWDTGRTLINRAFGGDYPGTYAIRRSTFVRMGGYAGDVLFENLELARSVRANGGTEVVDRSLLIPRRPPTVGHFLRQRVRQAYDDLAQPGRLVAEAALLPTALALVVTWRRRLGRRPATVPGAAVVLAGLVGIVAVAEYGRRVDGAAAVFPRGAALWAPAWVAERALTVWMALGYRLAGGVPYAGGRLKVAAHSMRELRRRAARSRNQHDPGDSPGS
jgi:hypothetical protein